jgi:pyruvate/2-oxoglutarate dehydrogenase complex dihydrolipoamide dehydrogenase (E3) component
LNNSIPSQEVKLMETADLIVIGSGQGGIPLASDFAQEGLS